MNLPKPTEQPADAVDLPIIMIGSGGHGNVLLDLLSLLKRRVLFVTDREPSRHGRRLGSIEVKGSDEIILEHDPAQVRLVNAVGSVSLPTARKDVYERFTRQGYLFETLIHPSATVASSAVLACGVQVVAGAIIQAGAQVGENVLVNTGASVDHDCVIGAHSHLAPGATLSGNVRVAEMCHIGTSASIIQGVEIGAKSVVGAGAVVIGDLPANSRVTGVPAKPMRKLRASSQWPEDEPFTVMLSAAGRRVALMRLIRTALQDLKFPPRLLATDVTPISAAFHLGECARLVPRYSDPSCLSKLLDLCKEFRVRLIMPTIDPDLPFFAKYLAKFEAIGTRVMISAPETIDICNDKKLTHQWLVSCGFPTVRQIDAEHLADGIEGWPFPVFVKHARGSSSVGARVIHDRSELIQVVQEKDFIVQDIASGKEYTVDVYVDRNGKCRCAVPRLRIETRGGEVSKSMTVRSASIEQLAKRVAEALPGAVGVLNIQIFHDQASGALNVSEINPRFGGGYPLTHEAGAPMARWFIEEMMGRQIPDSDDWTDGLLMLRYDEATFVKSDDARNSALRSMSEVPGR